MNRNRTRSLAAVALSALALALLPALPLLGTGCIPQAKPAAKAAPAPIAKSAAPIAGQVRAYGFVKPAEKPAPSTRYRLKMPLMVAGLPASVDLRPKDVPIYDQGQLGSCTGNGWAAAVEYHDKNHPVAAPAISAFDRVLIFLHVKSQPETPKPTFYTPSRLFIYYGERKLEGTIGYDAGAAVADGGRVVSTLGTPPETDWAYNVARFAQKPPAKAFTDAAAHVSPVPSSLDTTDLDEVRTALAQGHPVVFGFDVYSSFESVGDDGVYVPRGRIVGGHCTVVVGYDDPNQRMIVRNSWGTSWGDDGYYYFPYKYFASSMTSDAWTLAN